MKPMLCYGRRLYLVMHNTKTDHTIASTKFTADLVLGYKHVTATKGRA